MNNDKSFITKLAAIRESYNSKDFITLEKELKAYKDIIPEFFSRNGEATGIRNLYEKINDTEYSNKVINSIDLNVTESIYDDYLNGMYTFIQDLNTAVVRESDNVDEYEEKLSTAKENDSVFIESIFGGNLNPSIESSVKEATDNLEVLINFIPKIDNFYNKSIILNESMNNGNKLVGDSIELICESVGNYTYNVIKNIMTTYYDIIESFEEKSKEKKIPNYKLY
jgi:hypothetical protein